MLYTCVYMLFNYLLLCSLHVFYVYVQNTRYKSFIIYHTLFVFYILCENANVNFVIRRKLCLCIRKRVDEMILENIAI